MAANQVVRTVHVHRVNRREFLKHAGRASLAVAALSAPGCAAATRATTASPARPTRMPSPAGVAPPSYLGDLRVTSEVVPDAPQPLPAVTRDPKDDYLVALAQSASGDALISGDPHLTELTDLVLDDRSVFGKSSKGLLCFYIPPHS